MTPARPLIPVLLLCAAALLLPTRPAAQAAAPVAPTQAWGRWNVAVRASPIPASAGPAIPRRTVDQRLQGRLHHTHPRGLHLVSFVSVRHRFDHALPGTPAHRWGIDRQLDPSLEAAFVELRMPHALRLRMGRQDLLDTALPLRLDGLHLALDLPRGFHLQATAGLRTEQAFRPWDDDAWDTGLDPFARVQPGQQALVLATRGGWQRRHTGLQAGFQQQRALDGTFLLDQRVFAQARAGAVDAPHLTTLVRWHTLYRRMDHLHLHAVRPDPRTPHTLDAGATLARTLLPLDSPFAIFGTGARADAWAGRDWRPARRPRLRSASLAALAQARALDARDGPALDQPTLGLRTHLRGASPRGHWAWDTHAEALQGLRDPQQRAHLSSGIARAVPRGPDLQARLSAFTARDPRSTAATPAAGLFSLLGARFPASTWAHLTLTGTVGVDTWRRRHATTLVLADIRLPGADRW
jgi:hypothetical protein